MELKKLMEHISIIPDYRQAWKVEHKLSDILLLPICAVISGAEVDEGCLKVGFLFTLSCPGLVLDSVLQNFSMG
ncbi:transposase family protein, partial [Escherichia coli]|uniref:transposase family protein n=1 Tax=Escherichia coli TaxID=562 RepID=UPI003A103832